LLQSVTDRAGCSNNGPRAKRQQRPEHQRFNRKVHVILAREKIPGELENTSSSSRPPLFWYCSLDCDYAHVQAYALAGFPSGYELSNSRDDRV